MFFKTPGRLLVALSALAVLSIAALLAFDSRQEYQRELSSVKETLRVEAELLAEHAQLSFGTAERMLGELEERLRRDGLEPFENDKRYWERVRRTLTRTPQLAQIAIVDAQGRLRFTSTTFPAPDIDLSDREYFSVHSAGTRLHISSPVVARDDGRSLIPVTLRIRGSGGEFQGVLFASLDLKYFQDFYSSLRNKLDLRVGMARRDGTVLSLYPAPASALTAEVQDDIAEFVARAETAILLTESPIDGTEKLVAYHILDRYPVAVMASYDYGLFLSNKIFPLLFRNIIVLLVFATAAALSVMLVRRAMGEAAKARKAQHASERLCRAIMRRLPNGRVAVFDRERRYVFADGEGFSGHPTLASKKIVGKTMDEVYSPTANSLMQALAARAFSGEEEVPYEDNFFKVMAVPLMDEEGLIDRCMLLTQDITEFKQTQLALEALSATDSLLGIANRREFDRLLEQEWRRSVREQQPLALLMIDVDSFKLYNDTYGHQTGDECLRHVAQALREAVTRSGDLVARYGGEEITVLLPGTDLDGATDVAKRIHEALARKAIPFPASGVADRVTVSIGAASVQPSLEMEPAALVKEADSGVYAAKETGRNLTVSQSDAA